MLLILFKCMLVAVQFNDQSRLDTTEVDHIRTFRDLSFELKTIELAIAEPRPKFSLNISLFAPEFSRQFRFQSALLIFSPSGRSGPKGR